MAIIQKRNKITLTDIVKVDDAEELYNILLKLRKPKVDLSECEHIHAAILQLLLVANAELIGVEESSDISMWIDSAQNH